MCVRTCVMYVRTCGVCVCVYVYVRACVRVYVCFLCVNLLARIRLRVSACIGAKLHFNSLKPGLYFQRK